MRHLQLVDPIIPTKPSIPKFEAADVASDLKEEFAEFERISSASLKSRFDSNAAFRHRFILNAV